MTMSKCSLPSFYLLVIVIMVEIMSRGALSFSPTMQRNMGKLNINSVTSGSLISPSSSQNIGGDSFIMMAQRGGGQGSTKIDKKADIDSKTKPSYREEIEKDWRLILHDDTVHTIQQVCEILGTVSDYE
jgi:hypothetical protein